MPQAQTAPKIAWAHAGTNVSHFQVQIAANWVIEVGMPTPSGGIYEYALPALPAGSYDVAVKACYGTTCETSATLKVTKGVVAGATANNFYWVDDNGAAASWAACKSDTPLSGTAACSLDDANYYVTAGQTVFLRGGTYNRSGGNNYNSGVAPYASGTLVGTACTAPITYRAYPGETPILKYVAASGAYYGVLLDGRDCIQVFGLTFQNFQYYGFIRDSHYNEIAYSTFTSTSDAESSGAAGILLTGVSGDGTLHNLWNTHNWLHHNSITKRWNGAACGEGTDLIRIGNADGGVIATADNNYNTIEDNEVGQASHGTIDSYGMYGVIARNFLHNEPWRTQDDAGCSYVNTLYDTVAFRGKYGHRTFQVTDDFERDGTFNLIEGNRAGFASTNPGNGGANGMDIAAPKNIVRYNAIFGAMNDCLTFKYGAVPGQNGSNGGTYNRAYNNTLYQCGYGNGSYLELSQAQCLALKRPADNCSVFPLALLAIQFNYSTTTLGNVIKNNLIYDSRRYALSTFEIGQSSSSGDLSTDTTFENNSCTGARTGCARTGDPTFTNASLTDPTSRTLPDLSLQAASTARDIGVGGAYGALTTTTSGETTSTALAVADALYFQDGTWGSDLARTKTLFPDWVAVGTVSNVAAVSSINYGTNVITLATPLTWSNGAAVWLYKRGDGVQTLISTAPDYGAYEYGVGTPSAPTGLVVR
jgi:hypothetical protein